MIGNIDIVAHRMIVCTDDRTEGMLVDWLMSLSGWAILLEDQVHLPFFDLPLAFFTPTLTLCLTYCIPLLISLLISDTKLLLHHSVETAYELQIWSRQLKLAGNSLYANWNCCSDLTCAFSSTQPKETPLWLLPACSILEVKSPFSVFGSSHCFWSVIWYNSIR